MEASSVADPLVAPLSTIPTPEALLDPRSDGADGSGAPGVDRSRAAETRALGALQRRLGCTGVVCAARGLSLFGEHAGGWLALGLLGAAVDRPRRRDWLTAVGGVAAAHGASIVVKRVVRRPRPNDPSVAVLVGTPSRLSFPSSHASSTTAAAVLFARLLGRRAPRALVPAVVSPMLLSRLVLGVHFPSDVLAGSALGAAAATMTMRAARRRTGIAKADS
jgi:membrane-associated phospholipid phosphatase